MTTDNRTNEPTPEQVEAAAKAMYELRAKIDDPFWEGGKLDYGIKQIYRQDARAALEAVAVGMIWKGRKA